MKWANDNIIIPFKDREINEDKPVRVYRNLTKKGIWYSLRQGGRTVAHAQALCLKDCKFVVNERTRQRVLKTKHKEFHAYVEGFITGSVMGTTAKRNDLPVEVRYNPFKNKYFTCYKLQEPFFVRGAMAVICNGEGVKAAYTENFR